MNDPYHITPVAHPITASIRPPGSKSITNRAFVCAALADGVSKLLGVLDSEDTQVMVDCLRRLGWQIDFDPEEKTAVVHGAGRGPTIGSADLFVANSGTTIRFLTALVSLGRGVYRLDGIERMRSRPIQDLLDALRSLGVDAVGESPGGCPPVVVRGSGMTGGKASVRGDISSQFLSGLLMAAPLAQSPVEISVEGELVSKPYVQMTLEVMRAFGVEVAADHLSQIVINAPQPYRAVEYAIEPDASAASYFWAAAAITGGNVTVEGLSKDALQGDVAFCECLRQMGCDVDYQSNRTCVAGGPLKGIEVNMNAISDTVQTLAAVALFAEGATTITGVAHIRHKETDRIGDLARELRKLGAEVEELADGLRITPGERRGAEVETYNDHRMAMSLSLVGLRTEGVAINNPKCTEKTYPNFFDDLLAIRG